MSEPILIATIMRPEGDTGVQTHFRMFSAYLHDANREFALITPYDAPLWQVYPVFGLRMLFNFINPAFGVWWYRYWHAYFLKKALKHRLRKGDACVVYAQCPLSARAALDARVSNAQRVVMVVHFNISQADEWVGKGLIPQDGRLYRRICAFEAEVLPRLDGLVFVSQFMQRELASRIPAVSRVPAAVVPNFLPDPGEAGADAPPVADLINIGTLEARKNQAYLLEILAALRDMGRPMSLTLIGDGPDRAALEETARALELGELVRFAGFVRNAAAQIGQHRACIHVAKMENLPLTLIEAYARGRPIFAAPVGGVPEVLGNETAGRALPLQDAKAAAQVLVDAMADPYWLRTAGFSARRRFLAEYASDIAATRLLLFLEKGQA